MWSDWVFQDILRNVSKDIRLTFYQKSPSPSVSIFQLTVQRSKKQKFPLAMGMKQETTQKPLAGKSWKFPVP